ncbi:thiamine pyrophosphate-binding protein [Leucobacter albus]|uniref:Thiamine pyrophosphate-binding protein n=1 Tax=Leucobacter albus TaxID=272210 RepID=A0ABW3TQ98_9MICO
MNSPVTQTALASPTVSQVVAAELAGAVNTVFGVVGNGNAHVVDALIAAGVPFTPTRHEAGAVGAADGFARATGALALATTTYGPGFTNALTPLAEAVAAKSPLVLLTGAPPATPRPWDIDQAACARAVGAAVVRLATTGVAEALRDAVGHARNRRNPVVIELPYDIATRPALPGPGARGASPGVSTAGRAPAAPGGRGELTPSEASLVAEAASVLAGAERPLVVAGAGALRAGVITDLAAIARELGAATATTAVARGAFGEGVASLGVIGGFAAPAAAAQLEAADAVLVVGASLNPFSTRFGRVFGSASVVRIDLDPGPTQAPVALSIAGDAATLVPALREVLGERVGETVGPAGVTASTWGELACEAAASGASQERRPIAERAGDGRLDPRAVADRLAQILPRRLRLVQDIGHSISWAPQRFAPNPELPPLFMGSAFQSTGLGLLGAIGACEASRGELVVAAMGDGSSLMALADLDTLARSRTSCVVLVWNDAAYNAEVLQYANAQGLNPAPMLIDEVDFAAAARAVGGAGSTITELADLAPFEAWLEGGDGLYLLDCRISRAVEAPFMEEITASVVRHDTLPT